MAPINTDLLSDLQKLKAQLRQGQRPLADWTGGQMAVAAVPGAGKSHSLAVAAAIALAQRQGSAAGQLLIVTYTRSAAAAIKQKIQTQLRQLRLPSTGFSVQTIHGLALQIAYQHPEESGIEADRQVLISPNRSHQLLRTAVERWSEANALLYQGLWDRGNFDGEVTETLRRRSVLMTEVLPDLTQVVVREAKSSGLTPEAVKALSLTDPGSSILAVGAGLYEQYEQLMKSHNLIDFNDMILAALKVLDHPPLRRTWQDQFWGVFEDEAQDSSPLQEKLLTCLAQDGEECHFVRVGDPNQAINSTFTPADPLYFDEFCQRCASQHRLATMDQAGRSCGTVMTAANRFLTWANGRWQTHHGPQALPFRPQSIRPVDRQDPQPNPPPTAPGVEVHFPADIYQEVTLIYERFMPLLQAHPDHSAAILVREHRQAAFIGDRLQPLLRSGPFTLFNVGDRDRSSQIPKEMQALLQFIDRPHSPDGLRGALHILQQRRLIAVQDINALAAIPEQFLYPTPLAPPLSALAMAAQTLCRSLLQARLELAPYQLLPFLGLTLNYDGVDLATLQKLAERLQMQTQPEQSLKRLLAALQTLIDSEQFEAIADDKDDQYTRPGQITLITMHKAKGLDWDYVWVPFLHEDTVPGHLRVPANAQFIGDYTLGEVARAQIRYAVHHRYRTPSQPLKLPSAMDAWQEASRLKEAEEYRLLYVAMTRAKRLLGLSAAVQGPFQWNQVQTGRKVKLQDKKTTPALAFLKNTAVRP